MQKLGPDWKYVHPLWNRLMRAATVHVETGLWCLKLRFV
jgi:hypothetical protein